MQAEQVFHLVQPGLAGELPSLRSSVAAPPRPPREAASPADRALDPLVCPIMIGRARQIESLAHALDRSCRGTGHTVVIAGEAGIGKSRLVAAATARATDAGMRILAGACFEPDRSLPYAPLLDLIGALVARGPPEEIARALGSAAPELAGLVPGLSVYLRDGSPPSQAEPGQEKRRLVQALEMFLARLAATQPLVVVVEDLHWSDDASLELLLSLARRIKAQPTLLLLMYRDEEAHPALADFLSALDREHLATEMRLARLSVAGVAEMLRAIFGLARGVPAEFLDAVYQLTEGNPFFVEEVLRSLDAERDAPDANPLWQRNPAGGWPVPRGVHAAVRRRAGRLSDPARNVLRLAAVAGRRFDFALLRALSGLEEADLLRLVKELIGAQLVVEESVDLLAFRHALTREAIHSELLARERRALHRTVAETTERVHAARLEDHVADLARHFHEAGVWDKALAYGQRAGERAQALDARRAAVEQFTRALETASQLGLAPPPAILRARGSAYETLGDFERAPTDHEAALDLARMAEDRSAEWDAVVQLGALWASRDCARTADYYRRALDLARAMGDQETLARSLTRLGNWHATSEGSPRRSAVRGRRWTCSSGSAPATAWPRPSTRWARRLT